MSTEKKSRAQAKRRRRGRLFVSLLLAGLAQPSMAADDPIFALDLEELLNLEITSVSKKAQTVSQAAAAVFVITADDIRRSGATTLPEVLRMAPGVNVAQISSNAWAVSARGVNGRFSNKLLVLIDGRSVYTPTFSGVYWDVQDTVMADIERIEVIRGPGAALWGANAVNGVINIITKSAAATQGGMALLRTGTEENGALTLRYGGQFGADGDSPAQGFWRVYAKSTQRDGSIVQATGASGNDRWRQQRVGFRADMNVGAQDKFTVQGDYYEGRSNETSTLNFLTPPYNLIADTTQTVSGGNLLGRWERELSATDNFILQGYVDHTRRDWPAHLNETRNTVDVDFQYRTRRFAAHDLVLGASYRHSHDTIGVSTTGIPEASLPHATFAADNRQTLYSLFGQDDLSLVPEKLTLTLGMKLEKYGSGTAFQPNTRLLWTPDEATTLWAAASKASRTPSRIEHGGGVVTHTVFAPDSAQNPLPWPILSQAFGSMGAESMIAYEAGWKQRVTRQLSFDLAAYFNDYRNLRSTVARPLLCAPSGAAFPSPACFATPTQYLLAAVQVGNLNRAKSHGVELSADWRVHYDLRLQAGLSWFHMRAFKGAEDAFIVDLPGSAPRRQGYLRAAWNPRPDTDIDLWLRHVGRLSEISPGVSVPAYTELDLRLAWRPSKDVELSLVGRNLLKSRHPEFVSELLDVPAMEMQRSVYGQVTFKF